MNMSDLLRPTLDAAGLILPPEAGSPQRQVQRYPDEAAQVRQCRICNRTYERADHLTRHMKSHENARPFQCSQCQKSFNRVDLLNRHVATHERHSRSGTLREIRRSERVGQACLACAAAKAKCENLKPCQRCRAKNITCETTTQPGDAQTFSEVADDSFNGLQSSTQSVIESVFNNQSLPVAANSCNENAASHEVGIDGSLPTLSNMLDPSLLYDMNGGAYGTTPPLNYDSVADEMLFIHMPADFNNQNFDFDFSDFNFQDEQLSMPHAPKHVTIQDGPDVGSTNRTSVGGRDLSRGVAAFARSPWLWTPNQKDHVLNGQENIAVDEDSIPSDLTPVSNYNIPDVPSCGWPFINVQLRDKMYYAVVSAINEYHGGTPAFPNFPSLHILNSIIEAFFIRQTQQVENWIHIPTICMTDMNPEFALALVMGGSTVIAVPAIWKMGLALQDVIRIKVGNMWERKNIDTRKLYPLQSWMLMLNTGLWSGFQRHMELAESFEQPLITMLRRGGILAAPPDAPSLVPLESDAGKNLEMKWRTWAQRESFKRLSIIVFIHDTRASIALQKNPLMSLTELSSSLPASRDLFMAGSAAEWKSSYLKTSTRLPLTRLVDALHDWHILEEVGPGVDVDLCYTALLYGWWGQVWSFSEANKFHALNEKDDSVHRLWLTTQQRELYREIETFKDRLLSATEVQSGLIMVTEFFLMKLYVSTEDLQRFAGKSGEEAAAQAFVALEKWTASDHARRAAWHAGQVFRWAERMPLAELRDFYTITVYFASLTMWTYGHLSNIHERSKTQSCSPLKTASLVALNDLDTHESRMFVTKNLYGPALRPIGRLGSQHQQGSAIPLSDPNMVLKLARDLYRNNFPMIEEPLPPLVENMGALMRDLSSLPETRFQSRATTPVR